MELSKMLRDYSRTIAGKEQLLISAIAKALEIIPRQLCDNAGFDATNILNKLRQKHAHGKSSFTHHIYFGFIVYVGSIFVFYIYNKSPDVKSDFWGLKIVQKNLKKYCL